MYGKGEAMAIADLVWEKISGREKARQRQLQYLEITPAQQLELDLLAEKLATGQPVQYVLGEAWFLGRPYEVNGSVLIPRPETEELVMWAVEIAAFKKKQGMPYNILDIGTGSGCIAISLVHLIPGATITALDISDDALTMARRNAEKHHAPIRTKRMDILDPSNWGTLGNFDIIISNPPYIPLSEKVSIARHVTEWEPSVALFTPENDAQIFYRNIASFGKTHLSNDGVILVEGHQQHLSGTAEVFTSAGYEVHLRTDLNNNMRMLKAQFKFP
ncbi:MAG TPA: peptide chain release factor N(5)-glutamine methyltransferase [Phnomibacter sp.]|nr:peptide chain release factor N(5)-glutamine methyltransferase [Phnomibacter sp.]